MNQILYENRCKCNEAFSLTKKPKATTRSEGKPLQYPKASEIRSKTFQIKYKTKLSPIAKLILNSFQNKYVYYAIDDILYSLKNDIIERDILLSVIYSPIIFLQNNFAVNFFDIWIQDVWIQEIFKTNKFLNKEPKILEKFTLITIKFFYTTRVPIKKQESLW